MSHLPSLSTDQVAAFVELARAGSIRKAAEGLRVTEQGVRSRLLALEGHVGAELYRKSRGPRRVGPLTPAGHRFLPHAVAFLERAAELADLFAADPRPRDVHVAATQYLILYVLIDAVRRFHKAHPDIRVRLSSHTEAEVERALLDRPDVAVGVAAPYEPPAQLEYRHLFDLGWSLVTPRGHGLSKRRAAVSLADLAGEPLILFERGSAGRQHVVDAFHAAGVSPAVALETTNTEIIVRMVEAGLGVSVVPLMPGGAVTRGRRVAVVPLADPIRPIRSGVLLRKGERRAEAVEAFLRFLSGEPGAGSR
ncbi:MAG TPA: LysR substrate-binding domain-containing protein [Humisphaera sp.]